MEWVIENGGVQSIARYNCSVLTSDEWTERDGVKHFYWGVFSILYGILVELLYFPCLIVIGSKDLFAYSCFKIMFVLGIIDMSAIVVNSFIHGFLLIRGAVFCSYPKLIYVAGLFGVGLWCTSCMLCLTLVINRILEIWRSETARWVFSGARTYLFILPALLYGSYFIFFTSPVVFTSVYQSWFFNPFIFPNQTMKYQNPLHSANNLFLVGFTCCLYVFFYLALGKKIQQELSESSGAHRAHNQIFVQSSVICLVNMGASIIYVIMNFVPVPHFIIILGHMGWQLGQGCPAFIYLGMNRTIRNKLLRTLGVRNDVTNIAVTSAHRVSRSGG